MPGGTARGLAAKPKPSPPESARWLLLPTAALRLLLLRKQKSEPRRATDGGDAPAEVGLLASERDLLLQLVPRGRKGQMTFKPAQN